MQFVYDGKFYKAAKISGPKHNFLAISFGSCQSPTISSLKSKEEAPQAIEADDVLAQVTAGINKINAELGTHYSIERAQFIPSDTPSSTVYSELTMAIARRLYDGDEFISA